MEQSFPENNESITTEPGDIILYQGSNLCLYYDTNTWTFTSIGKIEGKTQAELKQILKAGQGNITVTLSLINTTGISNVRSNAENDVHYSLNGQLIRRSIDYSSVSQQLPGGIYVVKVGNRCTKVAIAR